MRIGWGTVAIFLLRSYSVFGSAFLLALSMGFYLIVDGFPSSPSHADILVGVAWLMTALLGVSQATRWDEQRERAPAHRIASLCTVVLVLSALFLGPFSIQPESAVGWASELLYGMAWVALAAVWLWNQERNSRFGWRGILRLLLLALLLAMLCWWLLAFTPNSMLISMHVGGIGISRWLHGVCAMALLASTPLPRLERQTADEVDDTSASLESSLAAVLLLSAWVEPSAVVLGAGARLATASAVVLLALASVRVASDDVRALSQRVLAALVVAALLYAFAGLVLPRASGAEENSNARIRWVALVWLASAVAQVVFAFLSSPGRKVVILRRAFAEIAERLQNVHDMYEFALALQRPLAEALQVKTTLVWRVPAIEGIQAQKKYAYTVSAQGSCQRAELTDEHAANLVFDLTQRARAKLRVTKRFDIEPLAVRRAELRAGLNAAVANGWFAWMELCARDGTTEAVLLLEGTLTHLAHRDWRELNALACAADRSLEVCARVERAQIRERHALQHGAQSSNAAHAESRAPLTKNNFDTGLYGPATSVALSHAAKAALERCAMWKTQNVAQHFVGSDEDCVMEWVARALESSEAGPTTVYNLLHMDVAKFDLRDAIHRAGSGHLVLRNPLVLPTETQDALGNAIATKRLRASHDGHLASSVEVRCRVVLVSEPTSDVTRLSPRLANRVTRLDVPP